ncbi:SWIM-type domain-containing protein [Trichonephila clavipes]|nr:SWIM-type domain-containing protein [Trichonephila clavipes]
MIRAHYEQLSEFERNRIIGLKEADIPQDNIGVLYHSVPPRVAAFIRARGGSLAANYEFVMDWCPLGEEFYPYCIEDTDKSTPEKIVLRINLENEEAENFKNRYSVVSNTNWIVYGCTPNPQSHNTTSAETLRMLRVNDEVCQKFYQYFSDGMSPIEAIRFHENKFLLEDNFMGLANASINPTHNQIYYLHKCWRDANLGSSINPFDKLKEKVPFYESIGTTVKVHEDHLWAVLLVTPLMKRNHHLFSSKEIIFINSTSSCEVSSSTITILLSATKVGTLPLAVMIHASQSIQNYINAFQLLKMNFPQCFGGQDVRRF